MSPAPAWSRRSITLLPPHTDKIEWTPDDGTTPEAHNWVDAELPDWLVEAVAQGG